MDKKIGQKLNHIWEELRTLPEHVAKTTSDALTHVAKSLEGFTKAQTDTKGVLDKLLVISESDDKKRMVEGIVEVKDLYDELDKALKDNAPAAIDYPELEKMFVALGQQVDGIVFDPKAIAEELVKVLPKQKELTIDKKIEIFGKTITKLEGNTPKTPLFVSVVNSNDFGSGSATTVVSQGGSIPDDLIQSDGAGGRQLKVSSAGGAFTGLTDTQLRASPVPVSAAALPLPTGAATSAKQLPDNHQVAVSNFPATQPVSAAALPLPTGAATAAKQLADGHAVAEATKSNLLPYAQLLTASGSITPSAGKSIQLVWCQIVPSSDNAAANLVTIGWASGATLYRVYALGRSAVFTGAINQVLNITLATSEPVTVNIQYREV